MAEYPIVFTFKDTVSGNGFLAGVTINGRALMTREDDKWWTFGVRPAAIAASADGGVDPFAAYVAFRNAFSAALYDAAFSADSYEQFKAEVERFFYERDESEEARWEAAGAAIRNGAVTPEPPFDQLKRESPTARPTSLSIERLDKPQQTFKPSDNVLDSYALGTAA